MDIGLAEDIRTPRSFRAGGLQVLVEFFKIFLWVFIHLIKKSAGIPCCCVILIEREIFKPGERRKAETL